MRHPVTSTHNGSKVYVDLVKSDAAANIAQRPQLLSLVKEVLRQTRTTGPTIQIQQDMGRTVGYSYVVETSDTDSVFYAQLPHDTTYTRFVKQGEPLLTKYVSMILRKDDNGDYELLDAWIGGLNPPRPGSPHENAKSRAYWANHALILKGHTIQPRSVTKICPY